jgi:serine/threonine protein kinase
MDTTKFCPYCKEEIKVDAIKCRHCGSMISDETVMVAGGSTLSLRLALSTKYEIMEEIGRGGMAVVYKAIQKNLERVVALKALPPTLIHDKAFLERFHREARSAAKLSHPNIIIVHDEGIEGEIHYIAMEYLMGIDLNHLIQQEGKLSVDDSVEFIAPIASALEYAHSHGLVHRDVKSSNIFIAEPRRPVLTDFGIAHAASGTRLTMDGTILGTPDFMSPEQAAGREVDGRSDIYGLGVVLYHALTGRLPFHSDSPLTTIYKLVNENCIPLHQLVSVPDWLENVVMRCMEKDPLRRIQTGGELAQLLRARRAPAMAIDPGMTVQIGEQEMRQMPRRPATSAKPPQRPRPSPAPAKGRGRSKFTVPFLGALLVVVLAVGGYFLYRAGVFGPKMLFVPQVTGMTWGDAQMLLERTGFRAVLSSGPSAGRNKVVEQYPLAGSKIKASSTVSLRTTKLKLPVPSVIGRDAASADSLLRSIGFLTGTPIERAGPPEEKGKVVAQIPEAGSSEEEGATLTLVIGI